MAACAVLAAALAWPLRKLLKRISFDSITAKLRRVWRWEFWPPALFYMPVAMKYAVLAMKYRSLTLPTLANPGMQTGGLIGESKYDTLADLARVHPDLVAETYLVPFDSAEQQLRQIRQLRIDRNLNFPVVFKPDVGQRGQGFKVIRSEEDERSYVERYSQDVLVQKYAPGPHEVGIFYYRFPNQARGKIFSITEKVFPVVIGDGLHTIEELIRNDPRASIVAAIYLERFADMRGRVLAANESFRLVEAGNHCQGAIFLEGSRLFSAELEGTIDEISRSIRGFFVGRYDIRYGSEESLKQGRDIQIIELNGASAEATNIYDPKNSLLKAYQTLFRQWEIIFAVADQNRKQGMHPDSLKAIRKNWARSRRQSALYPVSD